MAKTSRSANLSRIDLDQDFQAPAGIRQKIKLDLPNIMQGREEGPLPGDKVIHESRGKSVVVRHKGGDTYELQSLDGKHAFDATLDQMKPTK